MAVEYSLWIMPENVLHARLTASIQLLAQEFGAVAFEPHVTLFAGPGKAEAFDAAARQIANTHGRIDLTAVRLDQSTLFTKTFFIQFAQSHALNDMSRKARAAVGTPSPFSLDPHLSLLYQELNDAQRKALCGRASFVTTGDNYAFDLVRLIELETPVTNAKQIKTWKSLAEYCFQ